MRTNAKALFLACLLALLAMVGWRGYVEVEAIREARAAASAVQAPPKLPEFPPFAGLGILEYVDEQVRPDTQALPVDLFRPSLDSMVSNLVNAILTDPNLVVPSPDTPPSPPDRPTLRPGEENLFELVQRPNGEWIRRPRQQPAPKLTYNGVFKRTDDRIAVWVTEANSRTTRFYREGDALFGATVARVGTDAIDIRLPDGTVQTLPRGESLTLPAPAPAPAEEETVVRTSSEDAPRGMGGRRGDGVFRRGGAQRVPTEQEMAAIERANPELAQRIREAVRRRQEQDRQEQARQPQGANP